MHSPTVVTVPCPRHRCSAGQSCHQSPWDLPLPVLDRSRTRWLLQRPGWAPGSQGQGPAPAAEVRRPGSKPWVGASAWWGFALTIPSAWTSPPWGPSLAVSSFTLISSRRRSRLLGEVSPARLIHGKRPRDPRTRGSASSRCRGLGSKYLQPRGPLSVCPIHSAPPW